MKKLLLLSLVALLGAAAFSYLSYENKIKSRDSLTLYGNVEIRQVDLSFRVEGRIQNMYFEEGDSVKKDDLLANLDDIPYKTIAAQTAAEIAQSQAAYNNAVSKYNRNAPLCTKNIVSKQECDDLLNAMNGAKAALDAALAADEHARNNLNDTQMYAPDSGIIMTRIQEPGAVVGAAQPVYTMSKKTPLWIRAYIPETQLANVKYGTAAQIITDSVNPDNGQARAYNGYVGYISPVAEFTPKTVETTDLRTDLVYRIRVYVSNPDEYLKQGMPVTIKINLAPTAVKAQE